MPDYTITEGILSGHVWDCCKHCGEDLYAVCCDDHDFPCQRCNPQPEPQKHPEREQ